MNDSKNSSNDSYLPLPGSPADNPAANLLRKKVDAAYKNEPNAIEEALDIAGKGFTSLSPHQQFLGSLINSSKSAAEIQAEWHEYYAGLSDGQKHKVWQEFYESHSEASHLSVPTSVLAPAPMKITQEEKAPQKAIRPPVKSPLKKLPVNRTVSEVKRYIAASVPKKAKALGHRRPVHSLFFGLAVGLAVMFILLFGLFNERFIAPLIQPSRSISNIPLIDTDNALATNPEIVIPKINVQIPVVYDVQSTDEDKVMKALENGVVNYADTARPGENGNTVIVGHSSNNIFNKGKYKFAFVLLSRLEPGDTFYLQKDGKRYTYQIFEKKIVKPNDTSVLGINSRTATASLITCDPPGTTINRLVVIGEQISPDVASNKKKTTDNTLATQAKIVPGNAPTLWSRFWNFMSR